MILSLAYPPACPLCQREMPDGVLAHRGERGVALCDSCQIAIPQQTTPVCQVCGAPVGPFVNTAQGCGACQAENYRFRGVVSLGPYEASLRDSVLSAKRPDGELACRALADLLWNRQNAALLAMKTTIVVPIPVYWLGRLIRPHLTTEVLAQRLAMRLAQPCRPWLLMKTRRTPRQVDSTPTARRTNQRRSFRTLVPFAIRGHRVLLVDDVLTTGGTADAAARVLLKAGATNVSIAVLARSLGRVHIMEPVQMSSTQH